MEYSLDDIELEYDDFVLKFFSSPPKECNMVSISLDCETIQDLFEKLVLLFKDGLVYFYGDNNKQINIEKEKLHIKKVTSISNIINLQEKIIELMDEKIKMSQEIIELKSKISDLLKN